MGSSSSIFACSGNVRCLCSLISACDMYLELYDYFFCLCLGGCVISIVATVSVSAYLNVCFGTICNTNARI